MFINNKHILSLRIENKLDESIMGSLKPQTISIVADLLDRFPILCHLRDQIMDSIESILYSVCAGNKILICGNGGSAADSEHIVGELMKSFMIERCVDDKFSIRAHELFGEKGSELAQNLEGAIPAISLAGHLAFQSAFLNDRNGIYSFAQLVYGLGKEGDVLIAISTSGNSKNVIAAAQVAKIKEMKIIALTGSNASVLSEIADVTLAVPATRTHEIQELHTPIYHAICASLETELFSA